MSKLEQRRLAMQIVSQLPDKRDDAERVLELARSLADWVSGDRQAMTAR